MNSKEALMVFQELCLSFEKSFKRIPCEKAVIGLSGGIDSALAATVAAKALGTDRLLLYYLPYKTSSKESLKDAERLCASIGAELEIIDITPAADALFSMFGNMDKVRKGNVMSRLRMITLFDKAQANNGIVLGTTNKTELLLGYGTWYGDTASSINVLGSLYKKDVREVSKAAKVPDSIVLKAPSGDLWPGQTDEDELGFTYEEADSFFYGAIELGMSKESLYSLFGKDLAEKIAVRALNSSFKRRLPVICSPFAEEVDFNKIDEILKKII